MALTALTMCILRMLYRLRLKNQRWRIYNPMLLNENRWRAMRYGMDEGLVDLAKGELVPVPQLVSELLEIVAKDAEALGCQKEIAGLREIVSRGTSSHRQVKVYEKAKQDGLGEKEALRAVVSFLIEETARGLA